jgi:hypothetical protein
MREVIARVVDGSRFREFKKEYGQTIVTVRCFVLTETRLVLMSVLGRPPGLCTHPRLSRGDHRK